MIKFFKRLFANDWELVSISQGLWIGEYIDHSYNVQSLEDYCRYEIYFSKLKGKYKLKCYGFRPKDNISYIEACQKLIKLNNNLKN